MQTSFEDHLVRTVTQLRQTVTSWRNEGQRIALVPTMGGLHDGHLSLIHLAKQHADKVIGTLFVNPTQFGPNEDFENYPRDEARDIELFLASGIDLIFAPSTAEMYNKNARTEVHVTGIGDWLEGASRPGFFTGVATIVTKLLIQSLPDIAVFGEKDYQQLLVIKSLVKDLNIPVEIIGAPTIRDKNGLALSSRNQYLTATELEIAKTLNTVLRNCIKDLQKGIKFADIQKMATDQLITAGFASVDYLELRHAETFIDLAKSYEGQACRLLAAATLGTTRLIDNIAVDEKNSLQKA